jgi:hypothetical protein
MSVPTKFYTFVDSQADAGKLTAARLNGDFDPLYACLDPATGGLEDTNVKTGAKIVCTDRAHTVTGVWTFTTTPVFGAAAIPNAALQTSVMLKTTYDTDADGQVEDSDTVDGEHASAFADASHNHAGADINSGTLDGDRLPAPSTTKRGGVVATGTPSGKFLRDDDAWVAPLGYALAVGMESTVLTDAETYYFGVVQADPASTGGIRRTYIPKSGTIKAAYIEMYTASAGTAENISMYIRLNDSTDTLIATVGSASTHRLFSNAALSIAVTAGQYIEIKMVCPTWATDPSIAYIGGHVYIELA